MLVPAWIDVDLDAVTANTARLAELAGSAGVMAVVKADAYGHGLVPSARAALRGGASWLGVAQLSEAVALREAGIEAPVLSWLHAPGVDFGAAITRGIDIAVPSALELEEVAAAARAVGTTALVQLKVDTGLARNGAFGPDWDELRDAAARLQAEGAVDVRGILTHLAYADSPGHAAVRAQQELFAERVRDAERVGLPLQVRHLANSAATLTEPSAAWDLVRPGLAVYGLSPVPQVGGPERFGLRPAMSVHALVTVTKRVPAGQGVSYGHTYVTPRETTLVDVPVGYADGIPRHASSAAPVQVAGSRHTVAGRVCMDQLVVDVGDQPVRAGDPVVLFGPGDDGEPTAQEWAEAAGTISYEIVTRMSTRLPRRWKGADA